MNGSERELTQLFARAFPERGPGPELWEVTQRSIRRRLRTRRVTVAALAAMVLLALAVVPSVLHTMRGSTEIEFYNPPEPETPEIVPAPAHSEKPLFPAPAPSADEPTPSPTPTSAPAPEGSPGPEPQEAAPAGPARVEIRDHRLVLLDADGVVVRELYGDYDPALHGPEYGMWAAALRPGSTTRDLAVTVVDGSNEGTNLRLIVVRDGGEPEVSTVASIDFEVSGHAAAAGLGAAWSPDGAFLAWLEPDAAGRAVLRGLWWSGSAPAGEATPPGGTPVDPDGVAPADGVTELRVVSWGSDPDHLVVRGLVQPDGQERTYTLPVRRAGGQLQPGQLARAG